MRHVAGALLLIAGCSDVESTDSNPDLEAVAATLRAGAEPASLPTYCTQANGVFHTELPVHWDQPDSPKFTYYFQIQRATEGDYRTAPLGIVIPGGAGAPSIGYPAGTIFPPSFNVIYTDVRGVGCNIDTDHPFAVDALRTEYFARDVLAIVDALRLRSYVLYGVSYGSVQATVMTNIAATDGIQVPSALVLEGVIGHWSVTARNTLDYNKEWTRAKALLPPDVAVSFARTPLPLGLSSDDWMALLTTTLNAGTTREHLNETVYYALEAARGDPLGIVRGKLEHILEGWTPEIVRLATTLHCTETAGSLVPKRLVDGAIVGAEPDRCPDLNLAFARPYDAADYPVNVPIYYFEGSMDPNTTPENAAYHYLHQTQTTRVFTLVGAGGHTAMSGTLHQMGCTGAIFTAIATNPAGLREALSSCRWPISVTVDPAS